VSRNTVRTDAYKHPVILTIETPIRLSMVLRT